MAIEHAGEQLYDIISLLGYDETSADRPRPPDSRRTREWRETFETQEAGEHIRRLSPSGLASDRVQ
jgi:hypothetical protein